MNEQQRKKALDSWKGKKNNAQGHFFEGFIKTACAVYKQKGIAYVEKMPEPFMVLEKKDRGIFKGRFIAHAQPDFMGTLSGGRSICFEAKYTSTDKLAQTVLTGEQWDSLEQHWKAGAKAGVCVGIKQVYAFVPWVVWRAMPEVYGRKYMTAEDLEPYRVRFNGACMFLDPIDAEAKERAEEAACKEFMEKTWGGQFRPDTAADKEAGDTLGAAKKRLWDKLQTVERGTKEAAEIERLETALQTVVGVVTANRLFEIIRREPKEKHAAFLKTTLEAALGGADYSACQTIDDMGRVYAKYFVESVRG